MRIILFSRADIVPHKEDIARIFAAIERNGFEFVINREFAESVRSLTGCTFTAEQIYGDTVGEVPAEAVMVCYGGDGTLLEGVRRLDGRDCTVAGINSGRLGFLALAPRSEIDNVFRSIAEGSLHLQPRTMLCIECEIGGIQQSMFALNEVSIQRLGATMISIETSIDGERVSTYNGDGVIVSTPTGSTAYSLSAGGPIIAPTCPSMVLTPLSPHNLTMRPIVMADSSEIELTVHTRGNAASISIDNRTFQIADHAKFVVKKASRRISLAVRHNISFYDTLRDKMMWGLDAR